MTCPHCMDAGDFFTSRIARHELKRYRKKGPARTTRLLVDAIRERGVENATLLDVGGGVGAIQHELLEAGARKAVSVDASPEYHSVSLEEARERGHDHRLEQHLGDFVDLAPDLPAADVVTLDRVVCCYPHMRVLVGASSARARRLYGLVFPREHLLVRLGIGAINLFQRLRGSAFRVFVHAAEEVEDEARRRGLDRVYQAKTFLWRVELFERRVSS